VTRGVSPVPPTSDPPPAATILAVDDETPVRALCRRVLERDGHCVLEARSAEEALALTAVGRESIQLLADVVNSGAPLLCSASCIGDCECVTNGPCVQERTAAGVGALDTQHPRG